MPFYIAIIIMILYFDTETSGLRPGNICQLSYIMQTESTVKAKNFFFAVDYVEYGAFLVHGFSVQTLNTLSGGKRFNSFIDEIEKDFSSADVVVAHNCAFDFSFMRTEFERENRAFAPKREFCSMKKSVPVCKLPKPRGAGYKYPKLAELCEYFNVSEEDVKEQTEKLFGKSTAYHDARFDTTAMFLSVNVGIKYGNCYRELEEFL